MTVTVTITIIIITTITITIALTLIDFFKLCKQRQILCKEFYDWWKSNKLDSLISPALGLPAFTHGGSSKLTSSVSYNFAFNLLDYPAGVVPITLVNDNENGHYDMKYNDSWDKESLTMMDDSIGLPIGVQVVTLPMQVS